MKGENMDLLCIGNCAMIVLVRPSWNLIRWYVAPEPQGVDAPDIEPSSWSSQNHNTMKDVALTYLPNSLF